jgi:hypothetical protein
MHIQPRYLSLDEILSGFYISVYSFWAYLLLLSCYTAF